MDVSKLEASRESINAMTYLDPQKKHRLRIERILELVERHPGEYISLKHFSAVANTGLPNVTRLLQKMLDNGLLTRTLLPGHKTQYTYEATGKRLGGSQKAESSIAPEKPELKTETTPGDAAALAMQFFWQTQSDSLHEFVDWLKK